MDRNRRWVLNSRPAGVPAEENFRLQLEDAPRPADGQVAVRLLYVSVDPYVRGRMRNVRSYVPPLEIGEVIDGPAIGRVVESRDSRFAAGDLVTGRLGWQDYAAVDASALRRIPADNLPLTVHLGALGMTGLTAYFGLLHVGALRSGETVLVSGAAGAVGSVAGQIARIKGARAVGIAGTDEKVSFLKETGFDGAVNYRAAGNLRRAIRDACGGVDVYFDNVGGEVSDAAVPALNRGGRVVVCGQIAIVNREKTELGPRNWLYFLINRARLEGFLVVDFADRYDEALAEMTPWVRDGRLRHRETIVDGLENAPSAFLGLFRGDNVGKMIVRISG